MDAKRSRLIAGCTDDSSLMGCGTHSKRLASIAGMVSLFDRGVESVHVDVDDFSHPMAVKGIVLNSAVQRGCYAAENG